jgi:hypothetical protein
MSVRCGAAARAALVGIVVGWAGGRLEAGRVHFEGVSLDLPDGWRPIEIPDGTARAWGLASPSGMDASLDVEVHPRRTAVHRILASVDPREIEREVRAAPGLSGFRLLDHRVVEVDGLPAHRIRGRMEPGAGSVGRPAGRVEQLQLVIGGRETTLVTFSWEEGRASEGDFDAIVRSARIERRAGVADGAGGAAAVLGVLAGLALASRRRRSQRVRG